MDQDFPQNFPRARKRTLECDARGVALALAGASFDAARKVFSWENPQQKRCRGHRTPKRPALALDAQSSAFAGSTSQIWKIL